MKKGFGILLLILGAAVFLIFITSCWWMPPEDYTHTGKGLFTQEQYLEFKVTVASEDIEIHNIEILDNDYPILINYSFTSSEEVPMYGEDVRKNEEVDFMLFALASIVLFIPGCILMGEGDE